MSSDRRTFEKYQSQTEDAWDVGDDDDGDLIRMTHDVSISKKDVKRTAIQVSYAPIQYYGNMLIHIIIIL